MPAHTTTLINVQTALQAAQTRRQYRAALAAAMCLPPADQLALLDLVRATKARICPATGPEMIGGERVGPGQIACA